MPKIRAGLIECCLFFDGSEFFTTLSQKRKFVVFDNRRFVIANSRPIPACPLIQIYPEPVSSDSSNHNSLI